MRAVIVGGADIRDYARARAALREDDFVIFCDCGLAHREGLGVAPDLIVGDFDSFDNPHADTETIVLPCVKDDTDTMFAVREALRRGFTDFLLLGAVGGRFDHSMGNIAILLQLDGRGCPATLLDDYSEMSVVSRAPACVSDCFAYFSLLPMGGDARGVTVTGAKYPLRGATLSCDYPLGVSNEPLPGETAEITVESGRLLLVKVF